MASQSTAKEDQYILNRNWRANARLNQRHHLFKWTLGYLLHPSVRLKAGAKVAEIGAGTCMWSLDLSHELAISVHIDAIDNTLAQCPPRSWLPSDITLVEHDVHSPFPSHMHGVYDLVHVQNWLCIWRDETSDALIKNLISLLKPGGYLQWNEQDPAVNKIKRAPGSSSSAKATEEILEFVNQPRDITNFQWVSKLGDRLSQYLDLINFDRHVIRSEHQSFWDITVIQLCEEFSSNLRRQASSEADVDKAVKLQDAAERASVELLNGIGIHQELIVAVAQKPLFS